MINRTAQFSDQLYSNIQCYQNSRNSVDNETQYVKTDKKNEKNQLANRFSNKSASDFKKFDHKNPARRLIPLVRIDF